MLIEFGLDSILLDFFLHDALNFGEFLLSIGRILLDPDEDLPDIDLLPSAGEISDVLCPLVGGLVIEYMQDILLDA